MKSNLKKVRALAASILLSVTATAPLQASTQVITPPLSAEADTWLSVSERVYGLSRIWERMGTFSPFISALPETFDLNELYAQYLNKVIDAPDMATYYELLARFVTHIGDGKSFVSLPQAYRLAYVFPWIAQYIGAELTVVAVDSEFSELSVGDVIHSINNLPALEFLENYFGAVTNTQAPIVRQNDMAMNLSVGPRQLVLDVQAVTPTGESLVETVTLLPLDETVMVAMGQLEATLADFLWPVPDHAVPLAQGAFATYLGQGIHQIGIRTFANPELPPAVVAYIAEVADSATGFVLDLRLNGGGAADVSILSQFAPVESLGSVGGAYLRVFDAGPALIAQQLLRAYQTGAQLPEGLWETQIAGFSVLDGVDMLSHRFVRDLTQSGGVEGLDIWDSELLAENSLGLFDIPVVILIDHTSASAAESFVITAQGVNNFTIMGTHTPGMAGDLLVFDLPGGGLFGLNVVKQVTETGQTINNFGLAPDIFVPMLIEDLLAGRDTQLQAAIAHLLQS